MNGGLGREHWCDGKNHVSQGERTWSQLFPAGSISGAGASEDGGCRKERELHPALSTTDCKDTAAGIGETEVCNPGPCPLHHQCPDAAWWPQKYH